MGNLVAAGQQQNAERDRRAYVEHDTGRTAYIEPERPLLMAAEDEATYMTPADMRNNIERLRRQMQEAAKKLDFITAAQLRDQMLALMARLDEVPQESEA